MRITFGVFGLIAAAGVAAAQGVSLEGRQIRLENPGSARTIPVRIAVGVDDGPYLATSGAHSMPITVVDGEAWGVVPPASAGTIQLTDVRKGTAADPRVKLAKRENADAIDVTIDGEVFTTYHYSNDERKPYLWPIRAEGGVSITRDWPMGERESSGDHPHHVSFWTGYGEINGHDYWEYGDRTGWQRTESIAFGSGDACGWILTRIVWEDKDHKPVIDETRTYRFYGGPYQEGSGRLFDVDVRFSANYRPVEFGDTKEGGMVSVRVADGLRVRGGTGTITNSEGGVGESETWGKPAAWCDYSGTIEGAGARGIAVFDHPSSFRYPTHWHVRDYGLMGANAFGYSYFYEGAKNGDYTVEEGDTMAFSYRVYVHSGDVVEADVATYYADFANPPKVTVE